MQSSPLLEYARENIIRKAQLALAVLYGRDIWRAYIKRGRWQALDSRQRMVLFAKGFSASVPVSAAMVCFALILWWMLNAFSSPSTQLMVPFGGGYLVGLLAGFIVGSLLGRVAWDHVENTFQAFTNKNTGYDYDAALVQLEGCPDSPLAYLHEDTLSFSTTQPITHEWDDLTQLATKAFMPTQLMRINKILEQAQLAQELSEKGEVHLVAAPCNMYAELSALFASAGKPDWIVTEQVLKLESLLDISDRDVKLVYSRSQC